MNTYLADFILAVHFAFVLFVVGGLLFVWIGAFAKWQWVRNLWFRLSHLAAILFVVAESIAGIWCPLTVLEDALRGGYAEKSFIARWIHRVLFYSFPEWVFAIAYVMFALAVVTTLWFVPPERRRHT